MKSVRVLSSHSMLSSVDPVCWSMARELQYISGGNCCERILCRSAPRLLSDIALSRLGTVTYTDQSPRSSTFEFLTRSTEPRKV
jgi:hypothetical protein